MEHPEFVIGIDPQINVLALCVVVTQNGKRSRLGWFQEQLKRKDVFDKAEFWEVYMIGKCQECLQRALDYIPKTVSMNFVSLWVEQQRGRCKTIPEAALASIAQSYGIEIHIPHPKTWKKGINFPTSKDEAGNPQKGNKHNKMVAEQMFKDQLQDFYNQKKLKLPKVIHHLCDAACLAYYGVLMKENAFISMSLDIAGNTSKEEEQNE